jgi:hypothetical protein
VTWRVPVTVRLATQAPALHVWPTAQLAPLGWLPVSVHAGAPDEQTMAAVWQGLADAQVAPWVQEVQVPAGEHTWSVPQLVPGAMLVPVSVQR